MKKFRFIMVKKSTIIFITIGIILAILLSTTLAINLPITKVTSASSAPIIVLDAGHGGMDGGVVGKNGTLESEINLRIATTLGELFKANGWKVVQTRTSDNALVNGDFNKDEDMKMRKQIIQKASPNMVISIHANDFRSQNRRGVQVFYSTAESKILANNLQKQINLTMNKPTLNKEFECIQGDYYIAQCATCPSVIIECGFLSNALDEALLNDSDYRLRLCNEILKGASIKQ